MWLIRFVFSEPQGCSIRRQLLLSVVVKRHFNLEALPGVKANYHFKKPRLFPAGSTRHALCPSLCLSPRCLAMLMRARPPREPACPLHTNKSAGKRGKVPLYFYKCVQVLSIRPKNWREKAEFTRTGYQSTDGAQTTHPTLTASCLSLFPILYKKYS